MTNPKPTAQDLAMAAAEAIFERHHDLLGDDPGDVAPLAELISRATNLPALVEAAAERDRLRVEGERLKNARWEREDALDRQLGDESIGEVLEERERLRAALEEIEAHGCCATARRILGAALRGEGSAIRTSEAATQAFEKFQRALRGEEG